MTEALREEIRQTLAAHAGQPVDYVALFMFLNTVPGGHYQDRYPESALRAELRDMLAAGDIEAWLGNASVAAPIVPGETVCNFRLRQHS